MTTQPIGRIVFGCVAAGLVVALALVVGPVGGAQEHVITGTVLLTFAASWALLAMLSTRWTAQPQRWPAPLAGYMALSGAALLVFAPSDPVLDALGWVRPPIWLALAVATGVRARRGLRRRPRSWLVSPLLTVYALCAVGGCYQTIRESLDR